MTNGVLDRRRFFRNAAASAAGVMAGPALLAERARAASTTADVLIIGAGMAGVSAASALRASGINPIIIEGRSDRIGGRIWTSFKWSDAPVDLGASWLTHETINPLAKLAAESGITTAPSNLLNFTLSEADGEILPETEVESLFGLYESTYAEVKLMAEQRIAQRLPDLPASDAFEKVIARSRLSPTVMRRLGYFLNYGIKEPNATTLCDLSLKYWDDDLVFVMLYTSVFPRGYVQLVNHLAAGLDIRMGHVVSDIVYGPHGVTVVTNQGEFNAPYAVVTLPHGVLRSGSVAFTPELPAWKQAAIERLHTGVSDKTYIRFPSVFWNPQPDSLGRIAETSESRWSTWINFYKYEKVPLLMSFNHDKYALQLESMSETQVMDAAMTVLRKQYGRTIPDPLGIQRSRWGADPFAHGTIAHVPPGATSDDYELMGMPVGPLGFAGDSTTSLYPTLVFGAYLTGQREGARILSNMENGSPPAVDQFTAPRRQRRRTPSGQSHQSPGDRAAAASPHRSAAHERAAAAPPHHSAAHERAATASPHRSATDDRGDRHRAEPPAKHPVAAHHPKKR